MLKIAFIRIFEFAALSIMLSLFVHASSMQLSLNNITQTHVNDLISYTECRINLTSRFISDANAIIPNYSSNISSEQSLLSNDSNVLLTYENTSNLSSIMLFIHKRINPDILLFAHNLSLYLRNNRAHGNNIMASNMPITAANAIALKSVYSNIMQNYSNCAILNARNLGALKTAYYHDIINNINNQVISLQKLGINTENLSTILDAANTSIILPMNAKITDALSLSNVVSAINSYCIYNGCANGYNYHLGARMAIAKYTLIMNKINATDRSANISDISNADIALSNAQSLLNTIGTHEYVNNESKSIWENITISGEYIRNSIIIK